MEIIRIPLGVYQTNCYLVKSDKQVIIIDPGTKSERIISKIAEDEKVLAIFLTHGHFDHIGAVDDLVKHYQVSVYAHANEREIYTNPMYNYAQNQKTKINSKVIDLEDFYKMGPFDIEVIESFGHSPGSVMFKIHNELFTGDTLFKNGVGRTDLYKSSEQALKKSLKLIKLMPSYLNIYPGHEDVSTLAEELKNNPHLQ